MSNSQTTDSRSQTPQSFSAQSVSIPVAAVLLTLLAGWFCALRPAQTQIAAIERQCNELARLVDRLNNHSAAVDQSNKLLEVVSTQAAIVESAESSLTKLDNFHQELLNRLQNIQQLDAMTDCLAEIESTAVQEREAMSGVLGALRELSETHHSVIAAGTPLPEVRRTLNLMDDLHLELDSQRQDAISAAKVVEDLGQICNGLLAARPQVETAAGVAERWNVTQNKLVKQTDQLATAEQAATRLAEINAVLGEQSPNVLRARRNLDRLVAVNQELGQQNELLATAINTVEQLRSLGPIVDRASNTVDAIQRLVVDVCLTHPAEVQAVASYGKDSPARISSEDAIPVNRKSEGMQDWAGVYQAFRIITPVWTLR